MGVNKDRNLDVSNTYGGRAYTNELYPELSDHDMQLMKELIAEVNEKGYHIQFLFQLQGMDREDAKVLSPVLVKYIGKFDRKSFNNGLIADLGVAGNRQLTDFMLAEFRKPNDREPGEDWNDSRRWAASVALLLIRDKSRLDEYIELVENRDTCDDCFMIILLLGKIKSEKSFRCLTRVLKKDNLGLQSAAISALGSYGECEEAEQLVLPFLESDEEVLQDQAKKSLRKIRKKRLKMQEKNNEKKQ